MGIVKNVSSGIISSDSGAQLDLSGPDARTGLIALATTTDDTTTTIFGEAIPSGQTVAFEIVVVAKEPATGDSRVDFIRGIIKNVGGTTSIVGTNNTAPIENAGATAWAAVVVADDAVDALEVDVTGEAAHTIDWSANIILTRL